MTPNEFENFFKEAKAVGLNMGGEDPEVAARVLGRVFRLASLEEAREVLDTVVAAGTKFITPANLMFQLKVYREDLAQTRKNRVIFKDPSIAPCGLCGDTGMVTGICKVKDKARNLAPGYSYAFRCGCSFGERLSKRIPDFQTDAVKEEFDWHTYDNSGPATEADLAKLRAVLDKLNAAFDSNKRRRVAEVSDAPR